MGFCFLRKSYSWACKSEEKLFVLESLGRFNWRLGFWSSVTFIKYLICGSISPSFYFCKVPVNGILGDLILSIYRLHLWFFLDEWVISLWLSYVNLGKTRCICYIIGHISVMQMPWVLWPFTSSFVIVVVFVVLYPSPHPLFSLCKFCGC